MKTHLVEPFQADLDLCRGNLQSGEVPLEGGPAGEFSPVESTSALIRNEDNPVSLGSQQLDPKASNHDGAILAPGFRSPG